MGPLGGDQVVRVIPTWKHQFPYKKAPVSSTIWGHSEKMALYEPASRPSPDPESACSLSMGSLAPRTARNTCLLIKPPRLWNLMVFLSRQPEQIKAGCLLFFVVFITHKAVRKFLTYISLRFDWLWNSFLVGKNKICFPRDGNKDLTQG